MDETEAHLRELLRSGQLTPPQIEWARGQARSAGQDDTWAVLSQILTQSGLIQPLQRTPASCGPGDSVLSSHPGHAQAPPPASAPLPGAPEGAPGALPAEVQQALARPDARWLGRYVVLEELGRGAMGIVWRAYDQDLGRSVAIKQLIPREGEDARVIERRLQRFMVEARATAKLRHPNIVGVYEVGSDRGQPFLVMDYIRGRSLEDVLAREASTLREITEYLRDVARGLGHAHSQGILHRDVKPANVLIDEQGVARLTDFGLARDEAERSGISQTGQILGTPLFLSPEQAAGQHEEHSPRSDVFSLGGVLYFCLAGEPPFPAENLPQLVREIVAEEPIPLRKVAPQVHVDLETIVTRCMAKEPDRRYRSGAEVAAELDRFLAGEMIEARPYGRVERWRAYARRHPGIAVVMAGAGFLIVALLVAGALGAAYSLQEIRRERDQAKEERAEALRQREAAEGERRVARAAQQAAEASKARAQSAETESRRSAKQLSLESAARGRMLRRALVEKGTRLRQQGFANEAAAFFAESLAQGETSEGRSGLILALSEVHDEMLKGNALQPSHCVAIGRDAIYVGGRTRVVVVPKVGSKLLNLLVKEPAYAMALAPTSVVLATGSNTGRIHLWARGDTQPLCELRGHTGRIMALSFRDDHTLLSASWDGSVRAWDVAGERETRHWKLGAHALSLAASSLGDVVGLSDGRCVILAGETPGSGAVQAGGPRGEGQEERRFKAHEGWVTGVSRDGDEVWTAGTDGTLARWSADGALQVRGSAKDSVVCMTYERGVGVLVGTSARNIQLYDERSLELKRQVARVETPIVGLDLRAGEAVACDERGWIPRAKLDDSSEDELAGAEPEGFSASNGLLDLLSRAGCSMTVTANHGVVFSAGGQEPVRWRMLAPPTALALGALAGAAGDSQGNLALVLKGAGEPTSLPRAHAGPIVALTFSRSGDLLLSAGARTMVVRTVATGRVLSRRTFADDLLGADFASDGSRWLAVRRDLVMETGASATKVRESGVKGVRAACFDPSDANTIYAAIGPEVVVCARGGSFRELIRDRATVVDVAISSKGSFLATRLPDGVISLWDLRRRTLLARFRGPASDPWPLRFEDSEGSILGRRLDGSLAQWETRCASGGRRLFLKSRVNSMVWTDAQRLALGTLAGKVHVVDVSTRRSVAVFPVGHAVRHLATNAQGQLVCLTYDGRLLVFDGTREVARHALGAKGNQILFRPRSKEIFVRLNLEPGFAVVDGAGKVGRWAGVGKALAGAGFNDDGTSLVVGEAHRARVHWVAVPSGEVRRTLKLGEGRLAAAISVEGTVAYLGVLQTLGSSGARGSLDKKPPAKSVRVRGTRGEVWRWDLQSGRSDVVYASERVLLDVSSSPGGGLLAFAGSELSLYDRRKERHVALLGAYDTQLNGGVFAPGKSMRLASPTVDPNQIRVWDLEGCGFALSGSALRDLVEARTGLRVVGFRRVFAPDPVDRARLRELVRWERK